MTITETEWVKFITNLRKLDEAAAEDMKDFVVKFNLFDPVTKTYRMSDVIVQYAKQLVDKYGEASAALTAEMYDEIAALQGVSVPPAVPAPTATFSEIKKALTDAYEFSPTLEVLGATTSKYVKQAGVDTTVQNAIRDGAQIAFVPHGDTCAFCITLASRGWRTASQDDLGYNGHVIHIHSNCDCTYAVRQKESLFVKGYDPQKYKDMYYDATKDKYATSKDHINALRRKFYAENKEIIAEQKASAYEKRKLRESPEAEEVDVT